MQLLRSAAATSVVQLLELRFSSCSRRSCSLRFVVLQAAFLLELGLVLLLEAVFALFQAAFLVAQLPVGLLDFAVEFLALLEEFVLGLELGFLAEVVRFLVGLADDFGGPVLALLRLRRSCRRIVLKQTNAPPARPKMPARQLHKMISTTRATPSVARGAERQPTGNALSLIGDSHTIGRGSHGAARLTRDPQRDPVVPRANRYLGATNYGRADHSPAIGQDARRWG